MNELRSVKKSFDPRELKEYKKKFAIRQIRFAFTKVALIFKDDIDIKTLSNGEHEIFRADKGADMFIGAFKSLESKIDGNIDWNTLGKLMWYSYQTSTYWSDSKRGIKNIFTKNNYVQKNEIKRELYYKWLSSIPKTLEHYNVKILKTMKVIF